MRHKIWFGTCLLHRSTSTTSTESTEIEPDFQTLRGQKINLSFTGSETVTESFPSHFMSSVVSYLTSFFWKPSITSSPSYGDELDLVDFNFDAILSQRSGSIRHFILDVTTFRGREAQSFPVVFDTGSEHMWLISNEYGGRIDPPRVGYTSDDTVPMLRLATNNLDYVTTRTECEEWRSESIRVGPDRIRASWEQPLCVSSKTTVTLKAVNGVLGADPASRLVKTFGGFWLVPQGYPRVGLSLGDKLKPFWVCRNSEMQYAHVSFLSHIWRTGATVGIANGPPIVVSARIDTGVNRLYLSESLWLDFQATLRKSGISLSRQVPAGDYYSDKCIPSAFPTIHLKIGDFQFDLQASMYVESVEDGARCAVQIYDYPDAREGEILVGAPVLTRVVTHWQSGILPRIGFCLPITV